MASRSDGTGCKQKTVRYSRMKQPSLIKQLRGILSEYPDGGQIIKELIQNAEDAGARHMKIMFDSRRCNQQGGPDEAPIFNKFFKGPALCVYNDAEFAEEDWEGIQMIYSSVKEEDKLKVGRFGLGFKSVFHITDFPCIISGSQILLVDPHKPPEEVNAMMNLADLTEVNEIGIDALLDALDGCFNFSRETLSTGKFHGTLLRFPLRESASELSETLYDESKIMDLFEGIVSEAAGILTFLKNLESIELYTKSGGGNGEQVVNVSIDSDSGNVRRTREQFKQELTDVTVAETFQEDVECSFTMTVNTTSNGSTKQTRWLIVNYVVGRTASPEFRTLIQDKHLGYSPCVGVAMCLDRQQNIEGHVFCFLPLPREGSRLTGLPFHINGFFAMSHNRHHLKWATQEQKGKKINDKSILWNERLIHEALPRAYEVLVQKAIQLANEEGNPPDVVHSIYKLFPDAAKVTDDKWLEFREKSLARLKEQNVVYCRHASKWIPLSEAIFVILPEQLSYVKTAVEECLATIGKNYVDIPLETFQTLKAHFSTKITSLTPEILASFLRQDQTYTSLKDEHKIHILTYLLSGQDCNTIRGLQLLPLASGEWTNFDQNGPAVYVCTGDETELYPEMENKFLRQDTGLSTTQTMTDILQLPIRQSWCQLRQLSDQDRVQLLKNIIERKCPNSTMTNQSHLRLDWLRKVWSMLIARNVDLSMFRDLPLLPVLEDGTWTSSTFTVRLVKLSTKHLLLKEHLSHGNVGTDVCSCLRLLGVTICPQLPPWIPLEKASQYLHTNSLQSITNLLSSVATDRDLYQREADFNRGTSAQVSWKDSFLHFMRGQFSSFDQKTLQLLSRLEFFQQVTFSNGSGVPCSIANSTYFFEDHQKHMFPQNIRFPFPCVRIHSSDREFVEKLGGKELKLNVYMKEVLRTTLQAAYTEDTWNVIKFFIDNIGQFQGDSDLLQSAKQISFIPNTTGGRVRAMDVFEPTDGVLTALFSGQALLPAMTTDILRLNSGALRTLGIRTISSVTSKDLMAVARTLNEWNSNISKSRGDLEAKANGFIKFINDNPRYLTETCDGSSYIKLGTAIQQLSCINYHRSMPAGFKYPSCLKWYSHTTHLCKPSDAMTFDHWQLVGSTMPLVDIKNSTVADHFGWRAKPPTRMVMEQLEKIRYSPLDENSTTDIMPVLKTIYEDMTDRQAEYLTYKQVVVEKSLIWTDGGFTSPSRTIVSHDDMTDVEVKPYFQYIPQAFHRWSKLFQSLGCHERQTSGILISTLHVVNDKYKATTQYDEATVARDRKLVCGIFNRLAEIRRDDTEDFPDKDLIIMIQDEDESRIHFAAASACVYDDDLEYLDDAGDVTDEVKYLHPDIDLKTAKALGVKSLTKKSLLDAEDIGLEEWGQCEKLTARIHNLLQYGYTDGLSVPKELIQNADDAGATTVKFLYDERQNETCRKRLFSKQLGEFQGPALWVYNNAKFTTEDLSNITKLNGATKLEKSQTIGKFGLGFCCVYNLTDVPSFISGDHMVMFDPHEVYIEDARTTRGTGLKVKLTNTTLVKRHFDQFKPFEDVFGCKVSADRFETFNGTLFRLPLRTATQADKSEMSKTVYTENEMKSLLRMLMDAAGNMLLFSQNVQEVQLYHLHKNATSPSDMEHCFTISKRCSSLTNTPMLPSECQFLHRAVQQKQNGKALQETQTVCIEQAVNTAALHRLTSVTYEPWKERWVVSWMMNAGNYRKSNVAREVPLAAVASPVTGADQLPAPVQNGRGSFYKNGHLFCFMPLPLSSDLSIHINGCFDVTSDRRALTSLTEDDKRRNSNGWNEHLMETSLVKAFLQHLHVISNQDNFSSDYVYDSLWPRCYDQCVQPFVKAFYRALLEEMPCVFKSDVGYISFNRIVFLDPAVYDDEDIGQTAFEMLQNIPIKEGKQIVVIETDVLNLLRAHNPTNLNMLDSARITEEALLIHFLDNIDDPFCEEATDKRNLLLRRALLSKIKNVDHALKETTCIPTQPNGELEDIAELIDPRSKLAKLFAIADGRFPSTDQLLSGDNVLDSLVRLGMNKKYISNPLFLDRCRSVQDIAKHCTTCTHERILNIVKYIEDKEVIKLLKGDAETLEEIKSCFLLPVLPRPRDWCYRWRSDSDSSHMMRVNAQVCEQHTTNDTTATFSIGKPGMLHQYSNRNCIGSVELVMNQDVVKSSPNWFDFGRQKDWVKLLGVKEKDALTVEIVMQQLDIIADSHDDPNIKPDCLESVCKDIYEVLGSHFAKSDDGTLDTFSDDFEETLQKHIIFISGRLVRPENVAIQLKKECRPDLVCLNKSKFEHLFIQFGAKKEIHVQDIISILKAKIVLWTDRKCEDIQNIGCLLDNLHWCMEKEKLKLSDLQDDDRESIVAPDNEGFLFKASDLALEDTKFQTRKKVRLLHGNCVTPDVARAIGVQSKKTSTVRMCSELIPWGQEEKLSTRLNGLLKDYPNDESIMKELIQNADDAGATEIYFIKHYETKHLAKPFGSETSRGPALCIYNNSYFREQDFQGIKNLGIGSKSDDPCSTGQYGLGFNSVYHLTDVPSFFTKGPGIDQDGELCIFDPLMLSIGDHISEESPGLRCKAGEMKDDFPELLNGYLDIVKAEGTMFRLPLRTRKSLISNNCVTQENMDKMLRNFVANMKECLHFVKHIKCIKVLSYKAGRLCDEFSVQSVMSEEDDKKRKQFFEQVREVSASNIDSKVNNLAITPFEVSYSMTISDSRGSCENWHIVNRFGGKPNQGAVDEIHSAFQRKELGLLPLVGVSCRLCPKNVEQYLHHLRDANNLNKRHGVGAPPEHFQPAEGIAFCFLPLPVKTGLPFHVNGHFAVDRGRRGLVSEGVRKTWNSYMLSEVLAHAVHSTLKFLQQHWVSSHSAWASDLMIRKNCFEIYHSHFPLHEKARDDGYWKTLVEGFYKAAAELKFELYPSIHGDNVDAVAGEKNDTLNLTAVTVTWHYLAADNTDYEGGVFNTASFEEVVHVLKDMDINVLETPNKIRHTMKTAGIKHVTQSGPKFVLQCLETRRRVLLSVPIEQTAFKTVERLQAMLSHVTKSKRFLDHVRQLPINLTDDGIVRIFGDCGTFCSKFCQVLKGFSYRFVHRDLVSSWKLPVFTAGGQMFQSGILRELDIRSFVELLPGSFDPGVFRQGSEVDCCKETNKPMNKNTLNGIYMFIRSISIKGSVDYIDHKLFHKHMKMLNDWSFLPTVTQGDGGTKIHKLLPIKQTHCVISGGHGNDVLNEIIAKLKLPKLDSTVFKRDCGIPYAIGKLLASTDNACELLKCFVHYKNRIRGSGICHSDAEKILNYFQQNIDLLKKQFGGGYSDKLKGIPVFETIDGDFIELDSGTEIMVLPYGVPTDGVRDLLVSHGISVLREIISLDTLHKQLKVRFITPEELYAEQIVPHFLQLPESTWMKHLEYVRDSIMCVPYGEDPSDKQKSILNSLKEIRFVCVNGAKRLVRELYSNEHKLFKCMVDEQLFLPDAFMTSRWRSLMTQLGLNVKPSNDMILQYAKEIAHETATSGITDTLREKSSCATDCLFGVYRDEFDDRLMNDIKMVKFVVPFEIGTQRRAIFAPYADPNHSMICLFESVSSACEDICWTSLNILKNRLPYDDKIREKLGIYNNPPVSKVIQHCQNVCEVFRVAFDKGNEPCEHADILYYMECIYRFLDENDISSEKEKLNGSHVVIIPGEAMIKVTNALTGSQCEEIRPYLYQVPKELRKYFGLFEDLGAKEHATCAHYAAVLKTLSTEFRGNKLPPNKLKCAGNAIRRLFQILDDESSRERPSFDEILELYLPNKQHIMTLSSDLTVVDNDLYQDLLADKCSINFFIGLADLEIKFKDVDPLAPFKKLPETLQPHFLTNDVTQNIVTTGMAEIPDSQVAKSWQDFLRSDAMCEGVIRLVRHTEKDIDTDSVKAVIKCLEHLCVTQVTGLKTCLAYKGDTIEDTDMQRLCFTDCLGAGTDADDNDDDDDSGEDDDSEIEWKQFKLYLNPNEETQIHEIISDNDGVAQLIDLCVEGRFQKSTMCKLVSMLALKDTPRRIKQMLDRENIAAYNLPQGRGSSAFPAPGTYVDPRFYPFMVQNLLPFKEHEFQFAVMELDNNEDDAEDDETLYIYVNIQKELPRRHGASSLSIQYEVDVGARSGEYITVPLYQLFKFVPQVPEDPGQEVQLYDAEPVSSVPFDENCRRVRDMLKEAWLMDERARKRIIRRLLLRWHPDKNPGLEEYVTRVYNYLKWVIVRLERNESVDDPIDDNTGRSSPDLSGSRYGGFSNRAHEMGRAHAAAFRDNLDDYNRRNRTGNFNHFRACREARPVKSEARRWLKQAKCDLAAGRALMHVEKSGDPIKGSNWVCYICHQSCEKALKAAWYSKDANKCPTRSHSLQELASGLGDAELMRMAVQFEATNGLRGGNYFKLRYPDSVAGCQIPADMYDVVDAEHAVDVTKDILSNVQEFID